ncbi:MAG TPA: endoribonuclease MazF [Spirochaetales bacterium]|nr:endoribonuclease MazF [Spirochaetales bacterium]
MVGGYVPEQGDLVWLDFNPQAGHEQRGRRPAVVLSKSAYNRKVGLALFCPVTSKGKGYPFEVELRGGKIQGFVLSDQVKSLDWSERNIEFIETCVKAVIDEIVVKVELLIK